MGRMRLTELGCGRDRLHSHGPQQPRHTFAIHRLALLPEPHRHPAHPLEGRPGVRFIQQAQAMQILGRLSFGAIVITRP
jgi:hypothetical protein